MNGYAFCAFYQTFSVVSNRPPVLRPPVFVSKEILKMRNEAWIKGLILGEVRFWNWESHVGN